MVTRLYILLALFVPTVFVSADTYTWTQTLYGSGDKAIIDIDYDGVIATSLVSGRFSLYSSAIGEIDAYWDSGVATFVAEQNTGLVFEVASSTLVADTAYYLTIGYPSTADEWVRHSGVLSQAFNAQTPNSGIAFPQSPDQLGFVYFETDSNANIVCYSTALYRQDGVVPYVPEWYLCENSLSVPTPALPIPIIVSQNYNYRISSTSCDNTVSPVVCEYYYDVSTSTLNVETNVKFDALLFMLGFLLLFAGIQTWFTMIKKLS